MLTLSANRPRLALGILCNLRIISHFEIIFEIAQMASDDVKKLRTNRHEAFHRTRQYYFSSFSFFLCFLSRTQMLPEMQTEE